MNSRRWSNVTKIIVVATLAILAIVLLVTFRAMISPTIVAFLLAFILGYPVNWIQRQTGWARTTAVAVLYLTLFAALLLAPALIVPRALGLLASLQETLEGLVDSLQTSSTGFLFTFGNYHLSADDVLQQVGDALQNVLLATANPLLIFQSVSAGVIQVVYVLVLNFWLLTDLHKLRRLVYEQIPVDYQEDIRRLAEEFGETWRAFLRGQIALAFVVGVITWIPLVIVGMPNAGGLALLSAVLEFLPNVGQGISGTIGVTVALFQGSTWLPVNTITFALITLVIYSIIAQIENVYLVPRLVGGQVKLHPAVAFVGTVAGALVFGVLGVLLATPTIASARLVLRYVYRKLLDLEPFEPERMSEASVRIRGLIAGRKIEAIVFDLDGTLAGLDWRATNWAVSYFYWLDNLISIEQRRRIARRVMVTLEGTINFLYSRISRHSGRRRLKLQRLLPLFDTLRGYPPCAALAAQPAVPETLHSLAESYLLALISTRPRSEVDCFLANAHLAEGVFALTLSGEELRNPLPHSEGLVIVAQKLALNANQILMVSDTDTNLRAARAMEMATAGVLSGLGQAEDMREADLVLAGVVELVEWL
jgi:predicted PurR-regulated permease PerM/phosphoglycolate phosphatase-like HAD superfamily hydrolase